MSLPCALRCYSSVPVSAVARLAASICPCPDVVEGADRFAILCCTAMYRSAVD